MEKCTWQFRSEKAYVKEFFSDSGAKSLQLSQAEKLEKNGDNGDLFDAIKAIWWNKNLLNFLCLWNQREYSKIQSGAI